MLTAKTMPVCMAENGKVCLVYNLLHMECRLIPALSAGTKIPKRLLNFPFQARILVLLNKFYFCV